MKLRPFIAEEDKPVDLEQRNEIYLVLDNLRSVYNIGAIFRTADATKVKKIYLCGITAHPPRIDLEKTALGAEKYVPWEYCETTAEAINLLKKQNTSIIALEQTDQSIDFHQFEFKMPLALVIGNEVEGVSNEILSLCDAAIEITMLGLKNSLNVTTATGIVLYEAIK